jgi:hypothetical protein
MTSNLTRREFARRAALVASAVLIGAETPLCSSAGEDNAYPPIHYDADGLIVHKRGPNGSLDGGDTCQREGWYWFGVWVREQMQDPWKIPRKFNLTFHDVIGLLEPKRDGVFYRHPKLAPWNNPCDKDYGFSRDQMLPIMAAMGVWSQNDPSFGEPLKRLWNALPQDKVGGTKHTFNGHWWPSDQIALVYTGDIVGPATINFYRRALAQDPMKAGDGNGPNGERELGVNVAIRLDAAKDKDNTGDDLNLIVMLLLGALRYPNTTPLGLPPLPILPPLPDLPKPIVAVTGLPDWRIAPLPPGSVLNAWLPPSITTDALLHAYKQRPVSYGSYLGAYRKKYGIDLAVSVEEVRKRLDDGISSGWQQDAKAVYGAIRWYHREETGANPALAGLYEPIARKYLE